MEQTELAPRRTKQRPPHPDRILRPRDLAARLGISAPTLWRMRQRKEIPAPLRVSRGAVGWRNSTIDAWLADREVAAGESSKRTAARKVARR